MDYLGSPVKSGGKKLKPLSGTRSSMMKDVQIVNQVNTFDATGVVNLRSETTSIQAGNSTARTGRQH